MWDQGINAVLAKHLAPLGVNVVGIHREEFDPYGMTPKPWLHRYAYGPLEGAIFKTHALLKSYTVDLVHIHSLDNLAPMLSTFTPTLLHYHGSDIRGKWDKQRRDWRYAKKIIVSTRNLLEGAPESAEFLPNPVDTDLFKPLEYISLRNAALYVDYGAVDLAERIARSNGLPLVVVPKGTPYREVPVLLNRFTHYVDVKRDGAGRVLVSKPDDTGSLLGLQALACGLTVLTLSGERHGLPPEHEPDNVSKRLLEIYREVIG